MKLICTPPVIDAMIKRVCDRKLSPRQFKAHFGPSKYVSGIAFDMMVREAKKKTPPDIVKLEEYLMALYWLKNYKREEVCAVFFRVTEKTFRGKYKRILPYLSSIHVIDFESRHTRSNFGYVAKVSIDGTDCPIWEPFPFSPRWFTHKWKGPGIRYEIGLCIETGWIVWVNGGYPCGQWNDLQISRDGILNLLGEDEKVIADSGYRGDRRILHKTGENRSYTARVRSEVCSRHETVNSRIKAYSVASTKFRHNLDMHTQCIYSVVNLVQLEIRHESPLFQVVYIEA